MFILQYCHKTLYPHCDRMKKHILSCAAVNTDDADGEKRKELMSQVDEEKYGKGECKKRKRTHEPLNVTSDSCDDSDDELRLTLLTKLVKLKEAKNSTSLAKKPLSKFTDEDFERETKELTVKKLRLDVKLKEEQNRLYEKLGKGVSKVMKLIDFVLENQTATNVTVYAPAQEEHGSILQSAFEGPLTESNKGDPLIS